MTIFTQMSARIIKEQALVIGPLAWSEAKKVSGLTVVNAKTGEISLNGDEKEVVNKLVGQYERLFGQVSHEVCREAVRDLIKELSAEEIPSSLK